MGGKKSEESVGERERERVRQKSWLDRRVRERVRQK